MNITERKPFTPGEILAQEFLEPYKLTQDELAKCIGVTRRRINEIVGGRRAITPDTALRLAKFFRMTPEYWLNLQMKYELWQVLHGDIQDDLLKIKPIKNVLTTNSTTETNQDQSSPRTNRLTEKKTRVTPRVTSKKRKRA